MPTALEISLVAGILSYKCGPSFASVAVITIIAYAWFTVRTTSWRTQFRRNANAADQRGATTSLDSLLNYEAVKVRGCVIIRSPPSTSITKRTS